MGNKRITSTLYTETKYRGGQFVRDPNGFLYANCIFPTKIKPEDLPKWFVEGYVYKRWGYVSAKGVKHLLYVPSYIFKNHLFKDDALFISYDQPIVLHEIRHGLPYYDGYENVVGGPMIERFLTAAEKYSNYDVSAIKAEMEKKRAWYYANNPEMRGFADDRND